MVRLLVPPVLMARVLRGVERGPARTPLRPAGGPGRRTRADVLDAVEEGARQAAKVNFAGILLP